MVTNAFLGLSGLPSLDPLSRFEYTCEILTGRQNLHFVFFTEWFQLFLSRFPLNICKFGVDQWLNKFSDRELWLWSIRRPPCSPFWDCKVVTQHIIPRLAKGWSVVPVWPPLKLAIRPSWRRQATYQGLYYGVTLVNITQLFPHGWCPHWLHNVPCLAVTLLAELRHSDAALVSYELGSPAWRELLTFHQVSRPSSFL